MRKEPEILRINEHLYRPFLRRKACSPQGGHHQPLHPLRLLISLIPLLRPQSYGCLMPPLLYCCEPPEGVKIKRME